MFRSSPFALVLFALVLSNCSGKPDTNDSTGLVASNDFEHLVGWVGNYPGLATITKEKAHSGVYSTSVRPGSDYSMGFNSILSDLSKRRPKQIRISAWVFLPNQQVNAKLVTEIKTADAAGTMLFNEGIVLSQEVKKANEWQKVEKTVTLPTSVPAASLLQVYMWRADSSEPVYMDDMEIRVVN